MATMYSTTRPLKLRRVRINIGFGNVVAAERHTRSWACLFKFTAGAWGVWLGCSSPLGLMDKASDFEREIAADDMLDWAEAHIQIARMTLTI